MIHYEFYHLLLDPEQSGSYEDKLLETAACVDEMSSVLEVCAERDWLVASPNRRRAVGFKSRALGLRSLASFESLRRP